MRSQWFVIHTLSGQEQKVKESIEKRIKSEEMSEYIHEVLVPMEKVVEVRNQKKTVSTRKLWPGYVFVDMVLLDENKRVIERPWYFIKETPGVIGFVGGEHEDIIVAGAASPAHSGWEVKKACGAPRKFGQEGGLGRRIKRPGIGPECLGGVGYERRVRKRCCGSLGASVSEVLRARLFKE